MKKWIKPTIEVSSIYCTCYGTITEGTSRIDLVQQSPLTSEAITSVEIANILEYLS